MIDPRFRSRVRRRRQTIRQHKARVNFNWFLLFLTIISWSVLGFIVTKVEPSLIKDVPFADWYAPFFIALFASCYTTIHLLTQSWKQGLVLGSLVLIFFVLQLHQLASLLNLLLLIALVSVLEYSWIKPFSKRKTPFEGTSDVIESNPREE